MTHIEIYRKLEIIEEMADEYITANQFELGTDDRVCLQFITIKSIWTAVSDSLTLMEQRDTLCISCFHNQLMIPFRAASYYLRIQSPDLIVNATNQFIMDYAYLKTTIYKELKELVFVIEKMFSGKDCKKIRNTAFPLLKGKTSKREKRWLNDDDDDDDTNDNDNGPSAPAPLLPGAVPSSN